MKKIVLSLALLSFSVNSFAYFSLMDTGHIKDEGEYRIMGEGQILLDSPKGFNLNARFATGVEEDSEIQFEAGVGSIDFYLGAFWKWVPFPDTDEQPAIGARIGVTFADVNNYSTYGFNVTPLISKKFKTEYGHFSPYGGLPIGLQKNTLETFLSMQAAIGLEWIPDEWNFEQLQGIHFLVEYGAEIDDAFDYFTFGATYDF